MAPSAAPGGPAAPVFAALPRRLKLADQVVSAVEGQIAAGAHQPGEKLPPERVLCAQFGVSRTALREAVRSLVAKGLLEVRAGGGTRVRRPSAAPASQLLGLAVQATSAGPGVTWAHVLEARRVLEEEIAGLAAARRTEGDLEALRAAIDEMRARRDDAEDWSRADVRFHDALAVASGNPLMPLLLGAMQGALLDARRLAHRLPRTPVEALQHHLRVYAAVAAGDAAGARAAMHAHLDEAETTLTLARERSGRR